MNKLLKNITEAVTTSLSILICFNLLLFPIVLLSTKHRLNSTCSYKRYNVVLPADYLACKITPKLKNFKVWLKEDI